MGCIISLSVFNKNSIFSFPLHLNSQYAKKEETSLIKGSLFSFSNAEDGT